MNKYKQAFGYAKAELADKKIMLRMLEEAEKLSKVAAEYKATSKFEKSDLSPQLTPEILFGMS